MSRSREKRVAETGCCGSPSIKMYFAIPVGAIVWMSDSGDGHYIPFNPYGVDL